MSRHDALVVGLGAVGAATLLQLARRGARVLGIDRHAPPHDLGSSHGESRITRLAIGEGDEYVPLARRSHELWRELERASGRELLTVTGGLWIAAAAPAESHAAGFFDRTLAAARRFGIAHELLAAAEIRARFPQFELAGDERGYFEPEAGFLRPEACVAAQLEAARRLGAEVRVGESIDDLGAASRMAAQVVVAAGARLPRLLPPRLASLFTVTRQVQHWFAPRDAAAFAAPRFPVFIRELRSPAKVLYGFPQVVPGGGVKVATEQLARSTDPDDAAWRRVDDAEASALHRELVAPHLPGLQARATRSVACLYTATPGFHFLVDRHPLIGNVIIASACSGHGFKHSAALGELLAEWVASGWRPAALAPFAWERHVNFAHKEEKP